MQWGGSGWGRGAPAIPGTAVRLSCHDGTLESAAAVHGPRSHPIGIDYALAKQKSPGRFNDLAVGSGIRLDGGKIGCLSCHAIHEYAAGGRRTVIESSCEACHRL